MTLKPGHEFRPRFYPNALRLQKKKIRKMLGRVRPQICPTCRQYTPQVAVAVSILQTIFGAQEVPRRKCERCRTEFGGMKPATRPV